VKTQLEQAKETLYGKGGLGVTNLKLFPGSNRDVTAEEIAEQINAVVGDLMLDQGEAEIIDV